MHKLRILIVNAFYYPNMQGGAEQSVKLLAENLVNDNNDVYILSGDNNEKTIKKEIINGVKVFRVSTGKFKIFEFSYQKSKISKIKKIQQFLISKNNKSIDKDILNVLNIIQPDIIHTNSLYGFSFRFWKLAKKKNIPIIHTVRDIDMVCPVKYGSKNNFYILRKYNDHIVRKYSKNINYLTSPSNYTLSNTINSGNVPRNIKNKVIPNSVCVNIKNVKEIIKLKLLRRDKHIVFLFAGRLLEYKGIRHMIESFKEMEAFDCELRICGSGGLEEYVKNESYGNIKFIGKLDSNQLSQEYKNADVVLTPSIWPEPFGRVIIEASSYGCIVIATKVGGIPEIFQQLGCGELYEPGDKNALRELFLKFMNRDIYPQYLEKILENIGSYDIQIQKNSFLDLYKEEVYERNIRYKDK